MNQPMTAKEIEVWDEVFTGLIIQQCGIPEHFAQVATAAIESRRAAMIADAHVGKYMKKPNWKCRCREKDEHYQGDDYCEACHTRRPDEVNT